MVGGGIWEGGWKHRKQPAAAFHPSGWGSRRLYSKKSYKKQRSSPDPRLSLFLVRHDKTRTYLSGKIYILVDKHIRTCFKDVRMCWQRCTHWLIKMYVCVKKVRNCYEFHIAPAEISCILLPQLC